jgi:hypothetical protein
VGNGPEALQLVPVDMEDELRDERCAVVFGGVSNSEQILTILIFCDLLSTGTLNS